MKSILRRKTFRLLLLLILVPLGVCAQPPWPMASPTTPTAQRNALNTVRSQIDWLQNATRTAPSYATGAYDLVWQRFQAVRGAYSAFTATLTPQQSAAGANELAELDAGLDILQEAFTNYQHDVAAGRSSSSALTDLCHVLSEAAGVWLREFDRDAQHLHVGW